MSVEIYTSACLSRVDHLMNCPKFYLLETFPSLCFWAAPEYSLSCGGHPLLYDNIFQICGSGINLCNSPLRLRVDSVYCFDKLGKFPSLSLYPSYSMASAPLVREPIWGFFLLAAKHVGGKIMTGSFPVKCVRHTVSWTWINIPLITWPVDQCSSQGPSGVNLNSESIYNGPRKPGFSFSWSLCRKL